MLVKFTSCLIYMCLRRREGKKYFRRKMKEVLEEASYVELAWVGPTEIMCWLAFIFRQTYTHTHTLLLPSLAISPSLYLSLSLSLSPSLGHSLMHTNTHQ